mgnify:CR=1 FL=1
MSTTHPLADIRLQFERAFEAIGSGLHQMPPRQGDTGEAGIWHPQVTIEHLDDAFAVRVNLHGVKASDVGRFRIRNGYLEIASGVPEDEMYGMEALDGERNMLERERQLQGLDGPTHFHIEEVDDYGDYVARIPLPANVDVDAAVADALDGELVVFLPRRDNVI